MTVLIIGASDKPQRFSYKALHLLEEHGHVCVCMHPILKDIEGHVVAHSFSDIKTPIDTVTLYVSEQKSAVMQADIIALAPRRVIFNPGTESYLLMQGLRKARIECLEACTLILLNEGAF